MKEIKWKHNINDKIKDEKRDLTIIDREARVTCVSSKKGSSYIKIIWYKNHCNKQYKFFHIIII